jgi:PPM family protein phosphatase
MTLGLEGAMLSDPGRVRAVNEDCAAYVLPNPDDPTDRHSALLVVADGMGGHAAGEVASRLACGAVVRAFSEGGDSPPGLLRKALALANATILAHAARDTRLAGMGTTLTAVVVKDGKAWLGHVGDSRAYLLRQHRLQQLSEDHSLVAELVRRGKLSLEAARQHPEKNVIFQALGTTTEVDPSIWSAGLVLKLGDVLLLCSDGLTDLVPDEEIAASLAGCEPLNACQDLLRQALDAGGHDNITIGVFRVFQLKPNQAKPVPTTRVLEQEAS